MGKQGPEDIKRVAYVAQLQNVKNAQTRPDNCMSWFRGDFLPQNATGWGSY